MAVIDGVIGAVVGVGGTAVIAGVGFLLRERRNPRNELQKLWGLLQQGRAIHDSVGGDWWERGYNPEEESHREQLAAFIDHNGRVKEQIERAIPSPYPESVLAFLSHANYLATVVKTGKTEDWDQWGFPTRFEDYFAEELKKRGGKVG